ncbi:MAG: TetR family transcriptional regulator, partial [Acidobacteriota bacterium]|nr:TetR family transcriptional regulator [Acidobacteriota bacterium]
MDLFAAGGYDETTVDEIAERAGVSRRSFFRYFESKGDLMAYGMAGYGRMVAETVDSFPAGYPMDRVFRETVTRVAAQAVESPYTRKIMEIAAKYPAARDAQVVKMIEVHDQVAAAYARRAGRVLPGGPAPGILAGLTVSVLGVVFRVWFEQGRNDICFAAAQVLGAMRTLA